MYTIKFSTNDQDNLNIFPFKSGDEMPDHLDYGTVLKHSIETGNIEKESEIKSLVDGSNQIEAYFSSQTAHKEYLSCKS